MLDEFVDETRERMSRDYPAASQSSLLIESFADAIGYQAWRATRAYDHVEVGFGVKMRDGSAGYSVDFHDTPKGAPGRIVSIQLSPGELREFITKAYMALGEDPA